MDHTVSVSKGCFVFNPSKRKNVSHKVATVSQFQENLWHKSYTNLWNTVENKLQHVYDNVYTEVLRDLVHYVENSHNEPSQTIPIAALLTGINMPDHTVLFESLSSLLHEQVTPHVATLHAHDCTTVRAGVEQIVSQLMNQNNKDDEEPDDDQVIVKKQQSNFIALEAWYRELVSKNSSSAGIKRLSANDVTKSDSKVLRSHYHIKAKSPLKLNHSSTTGELKSPSEWRTAVESDSVSPSKKLRRSYIDEIKSPLKIKASNDCDLNAVSKKNGSCNNIELKSPTKMSKTLNNIEFNSPSKSIGRSDISESKSPSKTVIRSNIDELKFPLKEVKILLSNELNPSSMSGKSEFLSKLNGTSVNGLKSPSKTKQCSYSNESKSRSKPSTKQTSMDEMQSLTDSETESRDNDSSNYTLQHRLLHGSGNASSLKCNMSLEIDDDIDSKGSRPIIVVVIPEFEGFSKKVLQNLLTIASFQISALPITFVFGVATSVQALQRGLAYGVSSKISIEVFHSQKSINFLDHVLEQILLNDLSPFHLGGKTFRLFCEVFLFYDFSVEGFIQHLKFCMMEHLYGRNINSLCCIREELDGNIAALSHDDLADLRNVQSFQKYMESCSAEEIEQLKSSDKHLKTVVRTLVLQLYNHLSNFYVFLRVVHILFSTLPNAPLGQQIRTIYEKAISGKIYESKEYKECMKLLGFQSREELLEKLCEVMSVLSKANNDTKNMPFTETIQSLQLVTEQLKSAGMDHVRSPTKSPIKSPRKNNGLSLTDSAGKRIGRTQFLQNVLVCGKADHPLSDYEQARQGLVDCLTTCLPPFLAPLTSLPLHELVLFDDVQLIRTHLVGAPRAAIHMALNDPHYYLQCKCCALPNASAILGSLPDLCIAYKLHLECGKLINLYDWLQSFSAIVSPQTSNDDGDDRQVCPKIQARFASAVAELQFLGFIKSSKKKTDHVTRLTFNPK